jgi:AP-1 complex subunit gamma-1
MKQAPSQQMSLPAQNRKTDNLLDLLGDLDLSAPSIAPSFGVPPGGMLGAGGLADGLIPSAVAPGFPGTVNNVSSVNSSALHSTNNVNAIPSVVAFDKNCLKVVFAMERDLVDPAALNIILTASNSGPIAIQDFVFQAAVPKTFQLQLLSPSGSVLPPYSGAVITQIIKINNPTRQPLRMRIRLNYVVNGAPVVEQAEVNNFPAISYQ